MLVKATVAMSPNAPTENSANPEAEYSRAASMACRARNPSKSSANCLTGSVKAHEAYQPAGECMRLQGLSMSHKEHLVLRSVRPRVAEKLEESVACVFWKNTLGNGVQMQATAS